MAAIVLCSCLWKHVPCSVVGTAVSHYHTLCSCLSAALSLPRARTHLHVVKDFSGICQGSSVASGTKHTRLRNRYFEVPCTVPFPQMYLGMCGGICHRAAAVVSIMPVFAVSVVELG